MKMLKILFFIFIVHITCVGQQTFSISGQVICAISLRPHTYPIRVRINNRTKMVNSKGAFKIKNLESGNHNIKIESSNETLDSFYVMYDSTVLIQKTSLKKLKIMVPCSHCVCLGIDREGALTDIRKAYPKLLFVSGINGPDFSRPQFRLFLNKYGVYVDMYDFGCLPVEVECIDAYTTLVFAYLDKRFGKKWRKYAPKGTINLKR